MRSGTQARSTGQKDGSAVLIQLDDGVALLLDTRVSGRAVHFTTHAPAEADGAFGTSLRAAGLPVDLLYATEDAVGKTVTDDGVAGRCNVAFAHRVEQFQLCRVHAELLRGFVELDVQRIVGLHDTIAAVCPRDWRVGINAARVEIDILAPEKRGHRGRTYGSDSRSVGSIGPRIENKTGLSCGDRTVAFETLLQPDLHGMPCATGEKGLLARVFEHHRPARLAREQGAQELGLKQVLLGAEPAAHVVYQHAHLIERQAQHFSHDAAHHEGGLGRNVHGELARVIPVADTHVGLHVGWCRAPSLELPFDDQVSFGESTRDVAARHPDRRRHQVAAWSDIVYLRRSGGQRRLNRGHDRQHVIIDVDQVERFFGDLLTDRRNRGDTLAPESHLAIKDVLIPRQRS